MVDKIQTDISVLSGATGASITPGKRIPGKKKNMKSLATPSLRNDTITSQGINTLGIEKYQSLPPHLPKFTPRFKSLRNEAADDPNEYTDTSRTDKYDMSRTDKDKSIENLKSMNNKK